MHPFNAARRNSALIGQFAASLAATPRKSPVIEAIDEAIRECRKDRSHAYDAKRFNDVCDALDKLYEARALISGERA